MELLRSDKRVLKRAADLPLIFRVPVAVNGKSARFGGALCEIEDGISWLAREIARRRAKALGREAPPDSQAGSQRPRPLRGLAMKGRWGARPATRLYVETHVRRQLKAVRACLRLELLGTTAADDRTRIEALDDELVRRVPPLLQWGRLRALLARLPALSAAVPVVWAASILRLDDFSVSSAPEALLLLAVTAFGVWVLVVWPAVKLGFRVKRAIFTGGEDIAHPFLKQAGTIEWKALTGSAPNVYEAEDAAFEALRRRKPREHPLDMLLSFVPYVSFAMLGLFVVGLVDAARTGFEGYDRVHPTHVLVVLAIIIVPLRVVRNAARNNRKRAH